MPRHETDCRYFANGYCSKGNTCTFTHDVATRNENICHFNLVGKCSYGRACRFLHTRPRNDELPSCSTPQTSQNQQNLQNSGQRVRPKQLPELKFNAQAAEFVPRWKMPQRGPVTSYAGAAASADHGESSSSFQSSHEQAQLMMCPYHQKSGDCNRQDMDCPFAHGNYCDMCQQWSLHPYNAELRKKHENECVANHTTEMERAFLLQKTEQKTCGICMENIFEKNLRFGILNGCQHCFCLDCIRQWRSKDQENVELATKTVRSCPECRQHSDYVIPSLFWVESGQEKDLLIEMYKENTKRKICKYYSNERSRGACPFGNKCFYKHQLPDGSIDPGTTSSKLTRN
ncbi:E3 ubiquitin-protein ligase makorin [Caenorhabditis elegans]|uniref:Isoform b of E3 ubiquitin-protein ligase makorin n=1 Tax=Caenorhabditis elegans TaxID=6239 RepID=Q9N373-2|nr:E3 ubiquitin-protein ligase makorin [Caenorhabditis elegans]CCD74064.1 E3 ubiquitin-protein ligase makorin [Caenorhabditis elegans]|eukprot:NP_001023511.1 LEPtoderan male tail [Caenorhabditis elegans]